MVGLQVISREAAIENGLKRYFTGEPCKKMGHINEKYVSNYECCECRKIRSATPEVKTCTKNYRESHRSESRISYLNRVVSAPIKTKLQLKKAQCKKEGIPFNLTVEDISIPELCPLLGVPIVMTLGKGKGNRETGWSLDRLDPSKGYVKGNVWFISGKANRMKQEMTPDMMRHFADVIDLQVKQTGSVRNNH